MSLREFHCLKYISLGRLLTQCSGPVVGYMLHDYTTLKIQYCIVCTNTTGILSESHDTCTHFVIFLLMRSSQSHKKSEVR